MYKYTDQTNQIVVRSDGLWSGFIKAPEVKTWMEEGNTPEPAEQPTPQQSALDDIIALEQANPWTHRRLRDLTDAMVAAVRMANPAVDLSQIPGFKAVAELEEQIASIASSANLRKPL
jgi:hypothetical protein